MPSGGGSRTPLATALRLQYIRNRGAADGTAIGHAAPAGGSRPLPRVVRRPPRLQEKGAGAMRRFRLAAAALSLLAVAIPSLSFGGPLRVLASFLPMYLFTVNV